MARLHGEVRLPRYYSQVRGCTGIDVEELLGD